MSTALNINLPHHANDDIELRLATHRRFEQVLRTLKRAMQHDTPQQVHGLTGIELIVFPLYGLINIVPERADRSWTECIAQSRSTIFTTPKVSYEFPKVGIRMDVERFMWDMARALSSGMFLPEIHAGRTFGLSARPNLEEMGTMDSTDARLCKAMSSRRLSVEEMMMLTSVPHAQVVSLLNACHLVHCLDAA
jgi:hypothetical protein